MVSPRRPASAADDRGGLDEIQPREVLSQVFVAAFEQRGLLAAADAAAGRLAVVGDLRAAGDAELRPVSRPNPEEAGVVVEPGAGEVVESLQSGSGHPCVARPQR